MRATTIKKKCYYTSTENRNVIFKSKKQINKQNYVPMLDIGFQDKVDTL